MNYRPEMLLLLVLTGFTLLYYHDRFAHWVWYGLMLGVLGSTYYLAPEWFAGPRFRLIWWAGVALASAGLLLELATPLLG